MTTAPHTCLSCGRAITWKFALCVQCEGKYGKSASRWPAWLSYLWNETQRDRRRQKKAALHEVSLDVGDMDAILFERVSGKKVTNAPVDNGG